MADRDDLPADGAPDDRAENLFGGPGRRAAAPGDGADAERVAPPTTDTPPADTNDPHDADDTRHGRGGGAGSFLRELPVLLLIAFVLAFLLRTFVLQVFFIPSTSMAPTLEIDDRIVVEKLTYLAREPRRGEVVVFEGENVEDLSVDQSTGARVVRGIGQFLGVVPANARDFVKRVIGVEGDEVVIEDGQVFVNGQSIDEPYVVYPDASDYGPVTVPEDHLFFLGDNRPNSSDSRRGLGMVPADAVVGRAVVILWPFDHAGSLTGVNHDVPDAATSTAED
ncbi:MAG TPA: signal peptidase I [Egicoccus sp.]|nr:signal peptidase I [Egicoccus sp.]HSK23541.1 signal peptidase I [Egicoccus sp.]